MSFRLLISGTYACFPRPEFRDALVSYDVITPIAALGLIEAIHWKPAIRWRVCAIHLLRSIETVDLPGRRMPVRALRAPRWAVDFTFTMTARAGPRDSVEGHEAMFLRKARRIGAEHGFLGLVEFPAAVRLASAEDPPALPAEAALDGDLGWLPVDRVPEDPRRFRYFRARLTRGCVTVPGPDAGEVFS